MFLGRKFFVKEADESRAEICGLTIVAPSGGVIVNYCMVNIVENVGVKPKVFQHIV